ncbi:hypothetical protein CVT26_005738 [Gymnopilus dilepis]|uniref:Uncharacterized protein n=1 Tax=Gymnopilus dilepis TaxID=231916 RepID=A0A409VPE9_9AGAR|nr:hypothetical protein CVT26_005738 [Gymnopilus dilepis]
MNYAYSPLFPVKPKRRACGSIFFPTKHHRSRQWGPWLFFAALLFVTYSAGIINKLSVYYAHYTSQFSYSHRPADNKYDRPPTYTELREWEMKLPQHSLDLPFPEGKTGRYVLFSNSRAHPVGWNNKLNDMLMNTWLAHASNRGYVFHDFFWTKSHYPWPASSYPHDWIPRTPLNALISGPSAGGPWEDGDTAPRAISEAWFDVVCPKYERKIIHTREIKPQLSSADGEVIFMTWKKLLSDTPERCVEVVAGTSEEEPFPETFDVWFWSTDRSVSLWDEFKVSPVSRLLRTSPVVQDAIDSNLRLFSTKASQQVVGQIRGKQSSSSQALIDPFDRVLSIHVRRGDFKEACLEHAAANDTFYNWNLLSFLPDKFYPPPPPLGTTLPPGENTPENQAVFLDRCLPSAESIVDKVRKARNDYHFQGGVKSSESVGAVAPLKLNKRPSSLTSSSAQKGKKGHLDVLFIMSNDHTEWLDDLKRKFMKDGWARIITSRDLRLNAEQKEVSVAVDMDIGRRSAVFIGNGWSSFTSNVVHRRLVDGKEPISIRFW